MSRIHLFEHLSLQEKINFARHLALVVKAGLPLLEGLRIIRQQTTSKTLGRIIDQLITDTNNGLFLADSMAKDAHVFGDFFINIIRVGETSGTLSQNLLYLAEELQKAKSLQSKVRSAMVYPIVILITTLGVTGFLTFFVFPKLLPVFTGLNVELPFTTRVVIIIVDFLSKYFLFLFFGLVAFIIGIQVSIRKFTPVKYFFDRIILSIPVVFNLSMSINMVNFTRILSLLLKSGVRIVEAIDITSSTFNNLVYRRLLLKSGEEIRKGEQLASYLAKNKKYFPPLVTGMIQIGENTGNLEENLDYLAEYYTIEIDNRLHALTTLIEPIMLLVMGIMVAFVALSIITPIYSISQGLST